MDVGPAPATADYIAGEFYDVTFPGSAAVRVRFARDQLYLDPTDENVRMILSPDNGNGDWAAILELAWAEKREPTLTWNWAIKDVLDHMETGISGIQALTGRPGIEKHFSSVSIATTRQDLINAFPIQTVQFIGTASAKEGDAHGLKGRHQYTVLGFDAGNNRVHLRNPSGITQRWTEWVIHPCFAWPVRVERDPLGARFPARNPNGNGAADFWISLTDFYNWFQGVNYEGG